MLTYYKFFYLTFIFKKLVMSSLPVQVSRDLFLASAIQQIQNKNIAIVIDSLPNLAELF